MCLWSNRVWKENRKPKRSGNRKRQRNHAKRQSNWLSGVAILIAAVLGYFVMQTQKRLEMAQILARVRRGERVDHYDTVRRRKDGSLVEVSLTVSPMKNSGGKIVGASKIARDVTGRKRLQEQQKLVVSEMRHRIKNSLATIQAGSCTLEIAL